MAEDALTELCEKMDVQREAIRLVLADELGGDPEDYRADRPVTDGGE